MDERKVELEIPVYLPRVEDGRDGCLERLEVALSERKGIKRAHLERDASPPLLCVHYDPTQLSVVEVRRVAERAGARITNRYHHEFFLVEGMDCSDCSLVLEHGVARLDGVLSASVNYAAQTLHVEYDSQGIKRRTIEGRVRDLGYRLPVGGRRGWLVENSELLRSLLGGVALGVGWVGVRFLSLSPTVALGFYLAAYVVGGYRVARHAWQALRLWRFDTDLLMLLAALGAASLGEFADGALLLFLFSLAHALEGRALDKARRSIRALADLAPHTAVVVRDDAEMEVRVEELSIGEAVIVHPGLRIPVDGEVLRGRSAVDQSPVTGESTPVDKAPGDAVFAGSVNGEGVLHVRVSRLARDSTLARVVTLVERAQVNKPMVQRTAERFMRLFVPGVLIADLLLIGIPALFFGVPLRESFLRGMALLVAASPCALALAAPSVVLAGLARAARSGVLVKGGVHLENLGRVQSVAFDKTGTLTLGRPQVTDVIAQPGRSEQALLALAAAVESRSAHPLAQAVVEAAQAHGLTLPEVGDAAAITGRGAGAVVGDKLVWVGSSNWFREIDAEIPMDLWARIGDLEAQGKTVMLVAMGAGSEEKDIRDGPGGELEFAGAVAVADVVRPEAKGALTALRRLGVRRTVMLTGDQTRPARAIASQIGLTDVRSELMPVDKVEVIGEMVAADGWVAMVGDGINDAPALARATVGVAMGGAGSAVALETAEVVLMSDDLSRLPLAVGLGRSARTLIHQNLTLSLGVILLLVASAVSGFAGISATALVHEGSTVLVALNALRLLSYRDA